MKNNKKLNYLVGGLLLIAIVGLGVFAGSGYLFKGALTLPKPNPISPPVATKPPAPDPKYSSKGAASAVKTDTTAPTNQNEVFPFSNVSVKSGGSVGIIASSSNPTDEFWFAPIDAKPPFSIGPTMTHAAGNAALIPAPTAAGTYRLYVRDAAENYSAPSKMKLTVVVFDKIAPTITIESPKGGAQTVRATSFTVLATVTDNIGVTKIELHPHGLDPEVDLYSQIKPNKKIVDYSYTFKLPLSDTAVVPSIWAYDAAGNISKILISIKVENQAPDLSVSPLGKKGNQINPTDLHGPAESLKLNMKVDATSPHDISKIEFLLDGKPLYNSYNKLNNNKGFFVCPELPGSNSKMVEANANCYLEIGRSNGDKISESSGYHYGYDLNPLMEPTGYDTAYKKWEGGPLYHTLTIKAYDNNDPTKYKYIDDLGVSKQQIKFHLDWVNEGDYWYTLIVIDP